MYINNRYQILKELGRGGMGIVYHVRDVQLNRECALKVLFDTSNESKKRFKIEARAIAKLQHKNIITTYDIDFYKNKDGVEIPFFTMEHIPGISLEIWLKKEKPLAESYILFSKICEGVAYAHENNIIHRDLKPQNILINKDSEPIILDFGLAKDTGEDTELTKTGQVFGTPKYLAPEIVKGNKATSKCDLYALGVILYQILTDRVPFDGDTVIEIMFQLATAEPVPPSVLNKSISKNSDIEIVCLRSIEKNPKKRLASVVKLREEMLAIIKGEAISSTSPNFFDKLLKKFKYDLIFRRIITASITFLLIISAWYSVNIIAEKQKTKKEEDKRKIAEKNTQIAKKNTQDEQQKLMGVKQRLMGVIIDHLDKDIFRLQKNKELINTNSLLKEWERDYNMINNVINDSKYVKKSHYETLKKTYSFLKFFILPSLPEEINTRNFLVAKNKIPILSNTRKYLATYGQQHVNIYQEMKEIYTGQISHHVPIFSPKDKYFAHQDKKNINIVSLKNRNIKTLLGSSYMSTFSPNGNYFAYTANNDTQVKILAIAKKNKPKIFNLGKYKAKSLIFSPKEDWLFILAGEKFILGNLKNNKMQSFKGFYGSSVVITFLEHKKNLILYTQDNNSKVSIYQLNENKKWSRLTQNKTNAIRTYPSKIALKISPNKRKIACPSRNQLFISDFISTMQGNQSEILLLEHNKKINKVEFLDNDLLVSASENELKFSSISLRKPLLTLDKGVGNLHSYSKLKTWLFTKDTIKSKNDKKNDIYTLRSIKLFPSLLKTIKPTAYKPEDLRKIINKYSGHHVKSLIAIGTNNLDYIFVPTKIMILIWKKIGTKYQNHIEILLTFFVRATALSQDEKWLAMLLVGNTDPNIAKLRLYPLDKGKYRLGGKGIEIPIFLEKKGEVHALDISSDNKYIYICDNIHTWKCSLDKILREKIISLKNIDSINTERARIVSIKTKGDLIAVGQEYGILSLYKKNKSLYKNLYTGKKNKIELLAWANTKKMLAFVEDDRVFLLKKIANLQWEKKALEHKQGYSITKLMFNPKDNYLAIFTEKDFSIYDLTNEVLIPSYIGHHKSIGASYTHNWKKAVCATYEEVSIFDLESLIFSNYPSHFKDEKSGDYWPEKLKNTLEKFVK